MTDKPNLSVKVTDEKLAPLYTNHVQISHTPEEFVMEMFAIYQPQGILLNRVVLSPSHAKRLLEALAENIKKYEDKFGQIKQMPVPFNLTENPPKM